MLNVLKSHTSKSRRKSMSPNQSPTISPPQSPYDSTATSPFNSPQPSTTASPNISPTNSPMALRRASVYKNKSKKQITHHGTMDEIIRKKREVKRTRSKSTPSVPGVFNLTKRNSLNAIKTDHLNVKKRDSLTVSKRDSFTVKKRDSISGVSSYSEESVSDGKEFISSNESINTHTETKKRQFKKSPNQRKKSFGAMIGHSLSHIDLKTDFKRIMDSKTKLRRSSSHRAPQIKTREVINVSQTSFSDDENENYKGPLFQATTMFVPGYDFNTKTATPVLDRKPSTPLFGRRGSKERLTLPPLFNRNSKDRLSVPNLVRRGSKDKVKKLESRFSEQYLRSDSSPPEITLNLNSSNENNSSEDEEDFLTVAERQMKLNSKHKRFENMGKLSERRTIIPLDVPLEGKVKKISGQFESGSLYSKRGSDPEKEGFRKKLSSIDRSIFRQRADSFEKGALFKKNKCIDYQPSPPKYSTEERSNRYSCGGESGYASPNEINEDTYTNNQVLNTNKCLRNLYLDNLNKKKTRVESLQESTIDEDEFSNSWSHGQWEREDKTYHLVRQPYNTREFSTDLCVTEL